MSGACVAVSPASLVIAVLLLLLAFLYRWRDRGWLAWVAGVLLGVAPAALVVALALAGLLIGGGASSCTTVFVL